MQVSWVTVTAKRLMEEAFDLMLDPEDIMACTSYKAGKDILAKNGIEL